jgi:hypothetical protein
MANKDNGTEIKIDGGVGDQSLKVGATVKTWIAIALVASSLGFSIGSWASQGSNTSKEVTIIQETLKKMPAPEKIANREITDLQFQTLNGQLIDIKVAIQAVVNQLQKHQETSGCKK